MESSKLWLGSPTTQQPSFFWNEGETNEGVVVQDANDSMDIMFSQECVVAANPSGVETMVLASNTQEDPIVGHASPTDVVADS
ncbi:hypothetical protein AHAS_Ahas03G0370600 [Arachis hypogaea]